MSSPFAVFLKNLRVRTGQRQYEFANLLGYEQAYISSIELGLKGPSQELLNKLHLKLVLSEPDLAAMHEAASQSKRRFILPIEVPIETYQLCNELWAKIDQLYKRTQYMRYKPYLQNRTKSQLQKLELQTF